MVNADGSNPTQIINDSFNNIYPSWLPEGKHIVYNSNHHDAAGNTLFIANADGSNIARVSDIRSFFARWSPKDSKIAFISGGYPTSQIYVMSADGTHQTKLSR